MMLSALVFLMVQYQGVGDSQALIVDGYLPLALTVDQMRADQQRVDNDIERLLRSERRPGRGAASSAAIYTERLRDNLAEARVHATQARQMAEAPQEVAVVTLSERQLELIETRFVSWEAAATAFVQQSEAGTLIEADEVAEPLRRDSRALGDEIVKLATMLDGRIARLTAETEEKRRRANAIAFGLTTLALVVSMGLIGAVLYALAPITRLTTQVQRLAAGDYSGRVDVRGADEVAVLAGEFDKMVQALQLRDRTLVERAEQLNRLSRYLGSVLDSLEEGLFVVEEGLVTLANPAAGRAFGVVVDAPPPDNVHLFVHAPGFTEHHRQGADYEVRGTAFGHAGMLVVAADVTEQRLATERLAQSERLALIGQMLAQITHEVRNPLNAMSLNTELLAEELAQLDAARTSEAWDLIGTVSGEIDRLTEVTGHYLQLARRPAAQLALEDMPSLVADVVRLLHAELEQDGVTLHTEIHDPGPTWVDGNQLRQALLNVVRNAVEAGARALQLTLAPVVDTVQISLIDDGPGMTNEQVERAFDPFYSTKASGTGLGLAICRQILEDHHGTITVDTAPGRGATLTMVLPNRAPTTRA